MNPCGPTGFVSVHLMLFAHTDEKNIIMWHLRGISINIYNKLWQNIRKLNVIFCDNRIKLTMILMQIKISKRSLAEKSKY